MGVDIGCGTGYTASVLESEWHMVGIDLYPESLELCKKRGLKRLCRADLAQLGLPFKTESVDLVLALDVIEHIEDDTSALAECKRIIRDGGLLIATVPAFMSLWSPWDEALGHRRRYTIATIRAAASKSGMSVKTIAYFFFFIFPAAIVVRQLKRLLVKDSRHYSTDFIALPSWLNKLLICLGRLERWLSGRLNLSLPFGLSVICVMEKLPSKHRQ